jgi:hypothetical protein
MVVLVLKFYFVADTRRSNRLSTSLLYEDPSQSLYPLCNRSTLVDQVLGNTNCGSIIAHSGCERRKVAES